MKRENKKLEAALAAYEKERSVSSDAELESALSAIIEGELAKENCDEELVDAATDELLLLRGEDPERIEKDGDMIAAERGSPAATDTASEPKKKRARFVLLVAAIAVIVLAAGAFAFGVGRPRGTVAPTGSETESRSETGLPTEQTDDPALIEIPVTEPLTDESSHETDPVLDGGASATVLKSGSGAGDDFHLIYDEIALGVNAALSDDLPSGLPAFYDRYANGQGGPTVDFTDDEVASLYKKANEYVAEFFGDETAANMKVTEEVKSEFGDVFLLVCDFPDKPFELPDGVSYATVEHDEFCIRLPGDSISECDPNEIFENEFVVHAIKFAGISYPAVYRTYEEFFVREEQKNYCAYEYVITGSSDDDTCASVAVTESYSGEFWSVRINFAKAERVGTYSVIPYGDALAAARACVKEQTGEDLPLAAATLVYADQTVRDGAHESIYRVPVYRFFFWGTDDGEPVYGTVDVTATTFAPTVR